MLGEVLRGLAAEPRFIPSKYFYNERGGELFAEITRLDEYYLTRTERAIFDGHVSEMAIELASYQTLIELGSGNGEKIRWLLDHLRGIQRYLSVDISVEQLMAAASDLRATHPGLEVIPVCADFTSELSAVRDRISSGPVCAFFPGSTIGNFTYKEAETMLRRIADLVGSGGALLIGIDLAKDPSVVERAYNDPSGVTARFNKNVLAHLNEKLGSDFDVQKFEHHAEYNREEDRVEMYLVSAEDQVVRLNGTVVRISREERIRTEYSYKYLLATFEALAHRAGLDVRCVWTDEKGWFAEVLLTAR